MISLMELFPSALNFSSKQGNKMHKEPSSTKKPDQINNQMQQQDQNKPLQVKHTQPVNQNTHAEPVKTNSEVE